MPEPPPTDPRALVGRLYDEHGAALYRYALILLADPAGAEDVVQQVFTTLLRPGAARLENAPHYLRRAVRNECYSTLRHRKARPEDTAGGPLLEAVDPQGRSIDERIALERALRQLPAEQREVIHLHVFEGMTFQEVADSLGESINTVASRYRYALAKLKEALAG